MECTVVNASVGAAVELVGTVVVSVTELVSVSVDQTSVGIVVES